MKKSVLQIENQMGLEQHEGKLKNKIKNKCEFFLWSGQLATQPKLTSRAILYS